MVDTYDCSDCYYCENFNIECDHPWVQCQQKPKNKHDEYPKTKFFTDTSECQKFLWEKKPVGEAAIGDIAGFVIMMPRSVAGKIIALTPDTVEIEYDFPIFDHGKRTGDETRTIHIARAEIKDIRRA